MTSQMGIARLCRARLVWRDYLVRYSIFIDTRYVGKIRNGQCLELQVSAGDHTVQLRLMFLLGSQHTEFSVVAGETTELICRPAGAFGVLLWPLRPRHYLLCHERRSDHPGSS